MFPECIIWSHTVSMVNVVFRAQFYAIPLDTSLPRLSCLPKKASLPFFPSPVFICQGLDSPDCPHTCKILKYVGRKHCIFWYICYSGNQCAILINICFFPAVYLTAVIPISIFVRLGLVTIFITKKQLSKNQRFTNPNRWRYQHYFCSLEIL